MRKRALLVSCLLIGTLGLSSCSSLIYKIYHTHSYELGDESVLYVDGEWHLYCTICGDIGDVVKNTEGYTHVVEDAEGLTAAFSFSGTVALTSSITVSSALSVASGKNIELNLNYYDLTLDNGMVIDGDLIITNSTLSYTSNENPIESEDEDEEEEEEEEIEYSGIVTYADGDDEDDDPDTETEPGPEDEPVPEGGAEEITVSGQGIIVNRTGTLGVIDNILIDTYDSNSLITVNGGLVNLYNGEIDSYVDNGNTTDECAVNVTGGGQLYVSGASVNADDIGILADGSASVTVSGGSVMGTHAGIVTEGESGSTTISLTGGTISSSEGSGIVTRESDGSVEISISGLDTTIEAPAGAGLLLLNENCTTSIIRGYITGLTGVEIHAGSLSIGGDNTYIIGNGMFSDIRDDDDGGDGADGVNIAPYDALIESEVDTNYVNGCGVALVKEEADISVTINGGNIIAGDNLEYALYYNEEEEDKCDECGQGCYEYYEEDPTTPTISLVVNDGFFYGKLLVTLCGFITGGTFAETSYSSADEFNETGYIAENYAAVELDGYYVVGVAESSPE